MKFKALYLNVLMFVAVLIGSFAAGVLILESMKSVSMAPAAAQEDEDDSTPPDIFNIKITDITASSSAIIWETDEEADSLINYGLNKDYGVIRDPRFDKTEHKIVLDELSPETTYYFRITSSDEQGNQGISSDYSFTTKEGNKTVKEQVEQLKKLLEEMIGQVEEDGKGPEEDDLGALGDLLEKLKKLSQEDVEGDIQTGKQEGELEGGQGQEQHVSIEEVKEMIEQLSGQEAQETLEEIQEQVEKQAQQEIEPPTIMLDYADVEIGTDYAVISWDTDKEANSMVSLAHEDDYVEEANNPYVWNEGYPDEFVTYHVVEVNGLQPATTYHFQVSSESKLGLTGRSRDKTFKTKAVSPEIYNAQVVKVQEEQATIRWTTNIPCSSILEFTNLNTNKTKLEGNSSFLTVHSMTLKNLVFDTYYSVVIHVESEEGEEAQSQPITFLTVKDEEPPVISKVNTESTLYPGSENKIQTIASWSTDEPSLCQLFYHQGLNVADEPKHLEKEKDAATKHVQVVTNFLPATVYKFWIECEDEAGNHSESEDYTMLTPSQEESIIDIILKNFESSFGWLKNVSG